MVCVLEFDVCFVLFQGDAMNATWKTRLGASTLAVVVLAGILALVCMQPARAARQEAGAANVPHYSVIDSEAHNLIVTDNKTNTLYFYTIDRDKEIGSELKLRGSIDLNQVGKPTIVPAKGSAQ
jgi:hypothetical protein